MIIGNLARWLARFIAFYVVKVELLDCLQLGSTLIQNQHWKFATYKSAIISSKLQANVLHAFETAPIRIEDTLRQNVTFLERSPRTIISEDNRLSFINDVFSKARNVAVWKPEDLDQLLQLRQEQRLDWATIASAVGRSKSACIQKYFGLIRKNGTWSSQINVGVLDAIVTHGEDWTKIASATKIVSDNCRSLYLQFLKEMKSASWSLAEDELLMDYYFENLALSSSVDYNLKEFYKSAPSAGFKLFSENEVLPWRNISHMLQRPSIDCRRRFSFIMFSRDTSKTADVWLEGETMKLINLVAERKWGWAEVGRELGRTAMQCYNNYHNGAVSMYELRYQNVDDQNSNSNSNSNSKNRNNSSSKINHKVYEGCIPSDETNVQYYASYAKPSSNKPLGRLKSRSFDAEEDRDLLRLASIYKNKWKYIGSLLGRSNTQILSTKYDKSTTGWTVEDNAELFKLVSELGAQWTSIGKKLGVTAYVCRAAYKRLVDKAPPKTLQMPRRNRNIVLTSTEIDQNGFTAEESDLDTSFNDQLMAMLNNELLLKWNISAAVGGQRRVWKKEEDEYLKETVANVGRRWSTIAEQMGRSPEDVMLRYDFKIVGRKAGSWSRAEDQTLIRLVAEFGPRWATIGEAIGRTGPQCSLRYRQSLDPRLKWRLWTTDEDEQLIVLRDTAGYNWGMISAVLDRAAPSCRYRYIKLKSDRK